MGMGDRPLLTCSICDGVDAARVCEGTGKYAFDLRTRTEFEYCGKLRMDPALDFVACSRRVCGLWQINEKVYRSWLKLSDCGSYLSAFASRISSMISSNCMRFGLFSSASSICP